MCDHSQQLFSVNCESISLKLLYFLLLTSSLLTCSLISCSLVSSKTNKSNCTLFRVIRFSSREGTVSAHTSSSWTSDHSNNTVHTLLMCCTFPNQICHPYSLLLYPSLFPTLSVSVSHYLYFCLSASFTLGIVEEDVAKRLQDYGFHSPTMSWPVPGT